jgi:hypothetical protein
MDCHNFGWWMHWLDEHSLYMHKEPAGRTRSDDGDIRSNGKLQCWGGLEQPRNHLKLACFEGLCALSVCLLAGTFSTRDGVVVLTASLPGGTAAPYNLGTLTVEGLGLCSAELHFFYTSKHHES